MATGSPTQEIAPAGSLGIVTVPNVITLIRLLCIPIFLYLLFGRDNRAGAAWLLGGLGATDWVDGYVARRYRQVSEFGKMFDPTVDRLLFIVGVGGIIVDGAAPLWFAWLVVAREVLLGGTVALLTLRGMTRFDVTFLGKAATLMLMFAMPAFMLGSSDFPGHAVFQALGWAFGLPGLILSYYTAVKYIPTLRGHYLEGRATRANRREPAR